MQVHARGAGGGGDARERVPVHPGDGTLPRALRVRVRLPLLLRRSGGCGPGAGPARLGVIIAFRGASAASDEKCKETSISRREATRNASLLIQRTRISRRFAPLLFYDDLFDLPLCLSFSSPFVYTVSPR